MKHIRYIYIGLISLLLLFVFFVPNRNAISIAQENEHEAIRSLLTMGVVKGMVENGVDSKNTSIVSDMFTGIKGTVSKVYNYLKKISAIVSVQSFLVELTQSWFFKLLLLFLFLMFVINPSSGFVMRCLLITLFIAPGLNLVISGSHLIDREITKNDLQNIRKKSEEIQAHVIVHSDIEYQKKQEARQEILNSHGDTSPLLRLVNLANHPNQIHKESKRKILNKMIDLFSHTLETIINKTLLFLGLPILYTLIGYFLVRRVFGSETSERLQLRTLIGLVFLMLIVTGCSWFSDGTKTRSFSVPSDIKGSTISGTEQLLKAKESSGRDTLKGIDVSHYNGHVDWSEVAEKDIHFAYAKCTEGVGFKDPKFDENWSGMKQARVARGAYHFYSPNEDPTKQADFFISTAGDLTMDDLPPMIDIEGIKTGTGGLSKQTYMTNVLSWLKTVEEHYQRIPIIYTNNPFADTYLKYPEFAKYPLWIADYGAIARIPNTWKSHDEKWLIWQHTGSEKMTGIHGVVDGDLLVGDVTRLFQTP